MHILFMADHFGHSDGRVHGGTTYFLNTLPALVRAGVKVTACFMAPEHSAADGLESKGVHPIFFNRAKHDPRICADVWSVASKNRFDVMHLHSLKSHLLGRVAASLQGAASVVHLHDAIGLPSPVRFLQKRLAHRTAAGVAVSDTIARFAVEEYGLDPQRVHVLDNGMDLEPFARAQPEARDAVRRELGLEPQAPLVAVVGRLVPEKGQAELIAAFERVLRRIPGARLLVVGEGPNRAACETAARESLVEQAVIFTGQRRDIPRVLAAVDVVAVPSMWEEPFGYAALEAIAAGRAVVAHDGGALPRIVRDGQTGRIVKAGDGEALGQALVELLSNEPLRLSLGEQARRHAQNFTIDRHVQGLIEIYESAMGRAPRLAAA